MGFPELVAAAGLVVAVVWCINLFNFMDGMDGLAAGMAVFGFGALGVVALMAGASGLAVLCGGLVFGFAGFLAFNLPPARIFMGDVGSTVLGYFAAAISLIGIGNGVFPPVVPLLVFFPFLMDASVTLLRRLLRGEAVWRAHRTHLYQRLVALSGGQRPVLAWGYGFMGICAGAGVVASWLDGLAQWSLLAGLVAVFGAVTAWVRNREKATNKGVVA
jgi:UDP-N-acetylmuramyl pentapeptide phosphotransferase/UDP-N-acetylglucosamine-1-phosphate transferase